MWLVPLSMISVRRSLLQDPRRWSPWRVRRCGICQWHKFSQFFFLIFLYFSEPLYLHSCFAVFLTGPHMAIAVVFSINYKPMLNHLYCVTISLTGWYWAICVSILQYDIRHNWGRLCYFTVSLTGSCCTICVVVLHCHIRLIWDRFYCFTVWPTSSYWTLFIVVLHSHPRLTQSLSIALF
jgi:hypothetical protein